MTVARSMRGSIGMLAMEWLMAYANESGIAKKENDVLGLGRRCLRGQDEEGE